MSNPFKAGDKLVVLPSLRSCYTPGQVVTVAQRPAPYPDDDVICEEAYFGGELPQNGVSYRHFRAAIAGVDYPLPQAPATPFKVGDKLRYIGTAVGFYEAGQVVTVRTVRGVDVVCAEPYADGGAPVLGLRASNFEAVSTLPTGHSIAAERLGPAEANSGHLADGSSVQKHSAGPLYPCVLVWRDKKGGPNELTMKARGVARCLTYNDDTPQAEAKHMLLEMAHRLDALDDGKYDVGVVTPKNAEPLWFSTFDKAMIVAEAIKAAL